MLLATPPYQRRHDPTYTFQLESTSTPATRQQLSQYSNYPFHFQLSVADQQHIQQLGANNNPPYTYGVSQLSALSTQNIYNQQQELMQLEQSVPQSSWHYSSNGQLTPQSGRNHNRQSSLSSLGSAGPASPYSQTNSNPQVVLSSESAGDIYYDGSADQSSYYQKNTEDFLATPFQHNYAAYNQNSQPVYNQLMAMHKQNSGEETMSVPDYSNSGRPSVASTNNDSPATPAGDDFQEPHSRPGEYSSSSTDSWLDDYLSSCDTEYNRPAAVPKLDRTISDIYNDELYSPNFSTYTSAPSQPSQKATSSPSQTSDIFNQRLKAANMTHLKASSQSPLPSTSRGRSPFQQNSPLFDESASTFSHPSPQVRLGTAAQLREQQKQEEYVRAMEEHAKRSSPEQSTPKTISPKDALLEYHETEEDAARPLFPPQSAPQYQMSKPTIQEPSADLEDSSSQQSFASMATSRRESSSAYSNSSNATQRNNSGFNFAPPSVPGVQVPQQYPFVPQQRQSLNGTSNMPEQRPQFTTLESTEDYSGMKKPEGAKADSGTYTCTYHGCTLRFETPVKLQKHKREGHRQSVPLLGSGSGSSAHRGSDASAGMTSAALLRNSQAGPHKCERINPSTGKPCNTIFSRPYDLTRHEDTIHNARKQKVRCHLCTEEKTFSRNDALTRHMRVVHPEVDFPGKTRRRL